jgi:N-acetylglutamate synthase-like GNAT family acetyltransferase
VVPAARSRGAGGALVAAALIRAAATDRTLYVYTNIPGWYAARGFTCVERTADSPNAVLLRELTEP